MALDRRAFLRLLGTLPSAATLDPEKLLWIPNQMVAVPSTYEPTVETYKITLDAINAAMIDEFFRADPFLARLKEKTQLRFDGHTIEVPIVYR